MKIDSEKLIFAKQLRKQQTSTEKKFWHFLRTKKYFGLKFKRQVVIEPYIVDFYCPSLDLIIEFDGDVHDTPQQIVYDKKRDEFLRSKGYTVIRVTNTMLHWDPSQLLNEIDRIRLEKM
ncbi:MAG: endonuclease domain-containing protein [Candidatus Kapabacteria bacterium]|nr:endonuclease domain-containing protein [Candidatus Kapabacteria bacterium]